MGDPLPLWKRALRRRERARVKPAGKPRRCAMCPVTAPKHPIGDGQALCHACHRSRLMAAAPGAA